jgi:hypothetical protein
LISLNAAARLQQASLSCRRTLTRHTTSSVDQQISGYRSRRKLKVGDDLQGEATMIRKLSSGKYRLYSRKKNPKTGKRRNLGTFASREAALEHERAVQYFKRH